MLLGRITLSLHFLYSSIKHLSMRDNELATDSRLATRILANRTSPVVFVLGRLVGDGHWVHTREAGAAEAVLGLRRPRGSLNETLWRQVAEGVDLEPLAHGINIAIVLDSEELFARGEIHSVVAWVCDRRRRYTHVYALGSC